MRRFLYLLYKDYLLLVRDVAGLLLMFLMPILLVILMSSLQDSTFNVINDVHVPLLLVNRDEGELGNAIDKEITKSGIFKIKREIDGHTPTLKEVEKAVATSDFLLGIYLPENTTEKIKANVSKYVVCAFNGIEKLPPMEAVDLSIFIDPTARSSFYSVVMSTIRERAQKVQFEYILKEITKEVNRLSPIPISSNQFTGDQVNIKIQFAKLEGNKIVPNSVQHNVPAWTLFAIFFIVISLSGSIIKEREEGSFTRLLTMPCSYQEYLLSKAVIYIIVGLLQFAIMILIGIYVLPLFGLESLKLGSSITALFLLALSASIAAIGFGLCIGNISTTNQQSAVFGSISVVIMAAVGGVWVPIFLMSPTMQIISKLSPMNWGLTGFYGLFLKDEGLMAILPESFALILFGTICFIFAVLYNNKYRLDL